MQAPPISQTEIESRIEGHLDELLALWWAEQGKEKTRDLELIASVLPFSADQPIRALDLCCGPGDVGRAIRRQYANAEIDCVDRDPFLTAICKGVNRREKIPGKILVRDLMDDGWQTDLSSSYDAVATANALHWFDATRALDLCKEVHALLRSGGVFVLAEPADPEEPFAPGFVEWKEKQPPRYAREHWQRFWSRANALLGYDHVKLLGSRDSNRIDDEMSVVGWLTLLADAGFQQADVLLRDADEVIIGAVKA